MRKMTEDEFVHLNANYAGICTKCQEIVESGIEPDAEGYECEACGALAVSGLENAFLAGNICIT